MAAARRRQQKKTLANFRRTKETKISKKKPMLVTETGPPNKLDLECRVVLHRLDVNISETEKRPKFNDENWKPEKLVNHSPTREAGSMCADAKENREETPGTGESRPTAEPSLCER